MGGGGGNDYPRHRRSSTAHRSDIEIFRAITTEVLAATESALVALWSQNRNNSSRDETAISESEESNSAEQMSLMFLLSNTKLNFGESIISFDCKVRVISSIWSKKKRAKFRLSEVVLFNSAANDKYTTALLFTSSISLVC